MVLKVIYHDFEKVRGPVANEIFKLRPFRCRVVVLHGYLNDDEYAKLVRGSTYVVNAASGEGQCLPLMEYMSAGKPAIAPSHTAMEEYINEGNSFVIKSSLERGIWPHDPRGAWRTFRYRINWESLYNAYLESYLVAKNDPGRYSRMSGCAVESLKKYCSKAVVEERLIDVFQQCGVSQEAILTSTPIKGRKALRRILLLRIWSFRLFSKESSFFRNSVKSRLLLLLTFSRNCYVWFKKKSISKMVRLMEKYQPGRTL